MAALHHPACLHARLRALGPGVRFMGVGVARPTIDRALSMAERVADRWAATFGCFRPGTEPRTGFRRRDAGERLDVIGGGAAIMGVRGGRRQLVVGNASDACTFVPLDAKRQSA